MAAVNGAHRPPDALERLMYMLMYGLGMVGGPTTETNPDTKIMSHQLSGIVNNNTRRQSETHVQRTRALALALD